MALQTQNSQLQISAGLAKQFPTNPIPQVAFSGRSNVGKSSLLNTLLGRKSLARVSGSPGKTITVNFYNVDKKLFLVDLPGYGFAARNPEDKKKWSALTDGYFTNNPNVDLLCLVLQLVDSRVGLTRDDEMMVEFLNAGGIPYAVVATKVDKLNKTEREKSFASLASHPLIKEGTPIIPFSSLKGEGKSEVWKVICAHADLPTPN
ncbi:MAG: YihA family ribosome biogenesis GTP-binding protein [Ruminococcaceae bacterium]|nr:YihA family ribosome biogenesis GTP-binding protein [Oscillospiraceae bacterium]